MDLDRAWGKILEIIKDNVSAANFRTWFSQTSLSSAGSGQLILGVPSAFIKGQLAARYEELIAQAAKRVFDQEMIIDYLVDPSLNKPVSKILDQEEELFSFSSQTNVPPTTLSPKYTLANFVVGLTNNLAFAAAQAIVQNPGTSYNPLFIYGPSGVGKTHLMQGIGNALLQAKPQLKLVFASSERFMVDFVDSIQSKKTGDFRSKYRHCDVLLIDDIQFISGKDSTQEEFFHTFNELHAKDAQIVLTSDRPPNEMVKLESRLMSRFQGGLMVDIQLPDFDTRLAILKAKLEERGESLSEDYLKLIAEVVESNTRELEGKLVQILQMVKLANQTPSLEQIKQFLGSPLVTTNRDHKKVLGEINQYFNLKMVDLIGPRRQKGLVLPRHIAMFLLYEECHLPMEKIGQILGGRDHTTVLHGIEKIRQAQGRDREIQRLLIEVRQTLTN